MKNKMLNVFQPIFNLLPKFIHNILWDFFIKSDSIPALAYRYMYFKKYTKSLGKNVYIGKFTYFRNLNNLTIGDNVSIHAFCYLDAFGGIDIKDNVSIANHCTLISSNHSWKDNEVPIKYNSVIPNKIVINEDVWVAAGVRILSNVTISSRTIIGAGAVVNKSTDSHSIYVRVPAKKIKEI